MPWCKVTITYGAINYTQNYKRELSAHSHQLSQQFLTSAMTDSLQRINANLPNGHVPNPVAQNLLGILNLADQLGADPGSNYRKI